MVATISPTAIANMALSHIGKGTIEDIDLEQSAEAKACSLWYGFSHQQALRAHDWSFARKRIALATHNDAAPDDWAYRYQYPADCLALRHLINPLGRTAAAIPFKVEISDDGTKSILTDLEQASALYTFNQQTTSLFSPFFTEMFSFLLAHHIAFGLTGKRDLRSDMFTIYRSMKEQAPAYDANEGIQDDPREAPWIEARSG